MARTDTDADYWATIADALGIDPYASHPEEPLYSEREPIGGYETFPPGPSHRWPPAGEGEPSRIMHPSSMESTEGYIHDPVQTPMMQLMGGGGVKPSVHPLAEQESIAYPTTEREMLATMRMADEGLRPVTREQILGKSPYHPHEAPTAIGAPAALLSSGLGRPRPVLVDNYGRRYRVNREWGEKGTGLTKKQFDAVKPDLTKDQKSRMSRELKKHGETWEQGPRDYLEGADADVGTSILRGPGARAGWLDKEWGPRARAGRPAGELNVHQNPLYQRAGEKRTYESFPEHMPSHRAIRTKRSGDLPLDEHPSSYDRDVFVRRGIQSDTGPGSAWGTGTSPRGSSLLEDVSDFGVRRALHPGRYRGVWERGATTRDPGTGSWGSEPMPSNPMEVVIPPVAGAAGIAGAMDAASTIGEERKEAVSLDPRQALDVLRSLGFTLDMGDE